MSSFMPHGYCLRWDLPLIVTQVVGDSLIALAYFSIPLALLVLMRRRKDLSFGSIFWLFSAFIFSCGLTHVMGIVILWQPLYWAEAGLKVLTAIISVITAILLWPLIPKIVKMPSRSDMEQANEKLANALERLNLATRASDIAIWSLEFSKFECTDEKFLHYGIERKPEHEGHEFWARMMATTVVEEDLTKFRQLMEKALATNGSFTIDYRIRWPNGEIRHLRTHAQAYPAQNGKPIRILGTTIDVTKEYETLEQLKASERAALSASRVKSDFLANMSHEIRTPLNGVIGMTGLLAETELTSLQQEYVETVRVSGEALLKLINDILDFSKIEAGKMTLDGHPFDLRQCVEESLNLFAGQIREKRIETGFLVEPGVPTHCVGDAGRLRQVLTNLIENALKFTECGEVTLAVRSEGMAEGKHRLRFQVSDTGIGIATDDIPKLFQSFQQIDGSMRRRFSGTGLGLAICRKLVELMGGEIGVRSGLGKGSTFFFTVLLPAAPGDDGAAIQSGSGSGAFETGSTRLPAAAPKQADPTLAARRPLRILLAEDNPVNQKVILMMLARMGYRPDLAENGLHVIEAVERERYDVILMDIQMPEMDGVAAARWIFEAAPTKGRPWLVALTANAMQGDREKYLACGFDEYLCKPLYAEQLQKVLAEVPRRA